MAELEEGRTALEAVKAQPAPTAPKTAEVPAPAPVTAAPAAITEKGQLVLMAEQLEAAIKKLQMEEKLLITAELRVDSLKESIVKSKSTVDAARVSLAEMLKGKP